MAREREMWETLAEALFGLAKVEAERGELVEARSKGEESSSLFDLAGNSKANEARRWLEVLPIGY
jgi:hypothetical protein